MVSAAFGYYETLISIALIAAGIIMGVTQINQENKGLYGITVVYLLTISEYLQWILRQMIVV